MKRFECLPKLTEHLLFLALMVPTIALLSLAALSLAQPVHPSTVIQAQAMAAVPAQANPVDERGYDGTY
jgi:hypothetical protein